MTIEAFITVHDQELVLNCELSGKFAGLSHSYIFVGGRPTDRLTDVKVVVARDWSPNHEHLPAFYDFTGWSILASPGIVRVEQMICLQDDMAITDPFLAPRCEALLDAGPGPVAFTVAYRGPNWVLGVDGFAQAFEAGMGVKGISVYDFPPFLEWPTTQGTAWRTEDLRAFMLWFEPLFDVWADNVWAGHLAERSMWAWMMSVGYPARFLPNVIVHEALDRHGTGALMAGRPDIHAQRAATFGR